MGSFSQIGLKKPGSQGNQWHFCMKEHIGVDAESGLIHTVIGTAANVGYVTQGHALLHGEGQIVFADADN
jgi:transposase, IS5 family